MFWSVKCNSYARIIVLRCQRKIACNLLLNEKQEMFSSTKMDDPRKKLDTYKNVYCILLIYKKGTWNSYICFHRNSHISFHRRSLYWHKTIFFPYYHLNVIYMWINSIAIYLESNATKLLSFVPFIVDFQDFPRTFFQFHFLSIHNLHKIMLFKCILHKLYKYANVA